MRNVTVLKWAGIWAIRLKGYFRLEGWSNNETMHITRGDKEKYFEKRSEHEKWELNKCSTLVKF